MAHRWYGKFVSYPRQKPYLVPCISGGPEHSFRLISRKTDCRADLPSIGTTFQGPDVKEKLTDFFLIHGFKIMIAGFSLSAVGIILYIKMQHSPGRIRELGGTLVVIGIGLYLVGRICVIAQNRRLRKSRIQAAESAVQKDQE
jgi:hypothetical protein